MQVVKVKIKEDFIRLDAMLKMQGAVATGGHAKVVIQGGEVTVNAEICTMRGKKLRAGDTVGFDGVTYQIEV